MLPVLRSAANGEVRLGDVEQQIADQFSLSAEDLAQLLPSGLQRIFYNRDQWAKTYLAKAGLLVVPARGRFAASPDGRALLARNPDRIDIATLLKYPAFRGVCPSVSSVTAKQIFRPTCVFNAPVLG